MNLLFFSMYKFVKFFMSFLKAQVSFPSNFASIFSTIKINFSVFFQLKHYILCLKQPIKVQLFYVFECLGQNSSNSSCQFSTRKSVFLRILHHYSLSWHITPLSILSSHIFYSGSMDPIKVPILRLSSALVKTCHISHAIFGSTSQFSFKVSINLQCHQT